MKTALRLTTLLTALHFFVTPIHARVPGDVDPLDLKIVGGVPTFRNVVNAGVVQPDGKIIIAGFFSSVLGVPRNNIARINADGTLDMGFDPNPNELVHCVAVQADGKVLLGGFFTTLQPNGAVDPTTRWYLARVNADGTLDSSFDPKPNAPISCMALQPDGKLLLAGGFITFQPNGAASAVSRRNIARVNVDGTLDPVIDLQTDGEIVTLGSHPDGKVVFGGFFRAVQTHDAAIATDRQMIARINADGTLDAGFDPRANDAVECVAVQPDGKVLLGGTFQWLQPNGAARAKPRNGLARLNADGTLDMTFARKLVGEVTSLVLQANGRVLLGGYFTRRKQIARVNPDGTLDASFNSTVGRFVYGLASQANGKVLVGGSFRSIFPNDTAMLVKRRFFARLYNGRADQTLSAPDDTQVLWQRRRTSPEVSFVTFELSTDGGAVWTPLGDGVRIGTTADWQLTGLTLPASGSLRARGATISGYGNGSSGLVEAIAPFQFAP